MTRRYGDHILIAVSLLVIFQLYLYTAYPAFKNDDSPETITSAYTLGIGHPPSYPSFNLAAKIFSLLPVGSPAFRINLFSAFLAAMVMLLAYLLIRQNTRLIFGYENRVLNLAGIFVLGFSYIFWNQATEAKGGIYMLNLLFFVSFIYVTISFYCNYDKRKLYLLSFVYGLSLTDHWPSMVILLPVYLYGYFRPGNKIKLQGYMYNILLVLIGLSVYLYLPIRAGVDGAFVFWARPDNWHDFWWTILRSGYETKASLATSADVLGEFFGLTFRNYPGLIILFPFGAYILYKTKREIFFMYAAMFSVVTGAVIFLRIPSKELLWEADSLLLPSQFLLYVLIILGSYHLLRSLKKKRLKYGFAVLLAAAVMVEVIINFGNNNGSKNYISYDFGNNITKSIKPDSVCLLESDYYLMPLGYFSYIEHKISGKKYQSVYTLQYKWGIDELAGKYGIINLKVGEKEITSNVNNVVTALRGTSDIFLSYYVAPLKTAFDIGQEPQGILYKVTEDGNINNDRYFSIYSYRSIFDNKLLYDNNLACVYGERMAAIADEKLMENRYYEAIKWYKKALDFPLNSRADKLFDLSIAYKFMLDTENELKYLNMSIMEKPDFAEAIEAMGLVCYQIKGYPPAKELLGRAIELGSRNKDMLNRMIEEINKVDMNEQYKNMYNGAVSLLALDKYEEASYLFDYLIKKKVNDVGVARNLGVYFLKHNDYKLALDYFIKEKESDNSADSVKNMAYAYYKLGNIDEALKALKKGISDFKNDSGISGLYDQINKAKIQGSR